MNEGTYMTLNPWRSIWLRPRATIRQIVTTDPEHHVLAIVAANSVIGALIGAFAPGNENRLGLFFLMLVVLVLAPIAAVIMLYLLAALLRWTGRWLGGFASSRDLRAAIAWGSVPSVIVGAVLLASMLVPGLELFPAPPPEIGSNPLLLATYGTGPKLQTLAAIWSMVALVLCVGEVQGFSAWKALGNYLLAIVVLVAAVIVIAIAVGVVVGLVGE